MKIESTDQDIRTLLSSGYYRIPRFQRPYSWTRENIQDFWDDIIKERPADYFIGSMVLFRNGNQRFGIVDGQQRLTTITLLLAALRNALHELDSDDLAYGIHGLIERKNIDNKLEFILSTETSYPYLQDHILKFGTPEVAVTPMREEENLKAAFEQLQSLVGGVVDSQLRDTTLAEDKRKQKTGDRFREIRDAILNLKVIFVKLDDEDDAYIIFETLNTRGKDLSLTDLVKNHITKHLKARSASVDQAKVKWEQILKTIEGSTRDLETDTFIHHFWLSRYDYLPAKRLFKRLKREVSKEKARSFLDALVSDASIYRAIHEVTSRKWTREERRVRDALDALQLFRVQQQTPCVLSLVRAYKDKRIKIAHLQDALVAIEKFHFLFTAVTSSRSSGGISSMYAALGRRLSQAQAQASALSVIRDLKEKVRRLRPSLEEVKALFPAIIYTDKVTKERNLVRYVLTEFWKAAGNIPVERDAMTIEHLVPQKAIGTNGYSEEIVGQIGNLILVPTKLNLKLGSKPFKQKKRLLEAAKNPLPSDVAEAAEWRPDDIVRRTQALAEKAYNEVWRI
jgi:uncharacterized protein with ParB-like and HNH nuclease domain